MSLNVYDKNENHIGFISSFFPEHQDADNNDVNKVCMVALTDAKLSLGNIDMEYIKRFLGDMYNCKTLLGKVNEEKLKKQLLEAVESNFQELSGFDYESLLIHMFIKLKHNPNISSLSPILRVEHENYSIRGYILLDADKAVPRSDGFYIDEELEPQQYETLNDVPPVIVKIMDYPIYKTEVMSFVTGLLSGADHSDYGGRNHTHATVLRIKSGNYENTIQLPIHLDTHKNSNMLIYVKDKNIDKVLSSGKIYEYYTV